MSATLLASIAIQRRELIDDRWGPLLGPNKAFDPTRFFIFCANVIGSPYGTVSSVTINPETGKPYGPEMPGSAVKDDVR
jgi:homoserine O-acetyltransferase